MSRLRQHPITMTFVALGLAAGAMIAIALAYGLKGFVDAWSHLQFGWLAAAAAGQLLAIPAYVLAYRAVARVEGGPKLKFPLAGHVVSAGFGPFAVLGGFALDRRALHALADDKRKATLLVLGLGALEWAVLAPAACISAIVLLAAADPRPMPSLLWPWAIAVPIGFGLALWLATPERRKRLADGGRIRRGLGRALGAIEILVGLAKGLPRTWAAWVGAALYWALDIASLYAAARFVGIRLELGEVIVAYATGYALTRRSLPLAGAGVTEVLMTFALHWTGQPVLPSLATVVVYRGLNLLVPTLPALISWPRVTELLEGAAESIDGRAAAAGSPSLR